MNTILLNNLLLVLCMTCCARSSDLVERDTIRKTVKLPSTAEARRILVDNINGSISVVGYGGSEVELVVYKTINAESSRKMDEAKKDVTLDITEEADGLLLYVDAPWRRNDGSVNYRGWDYYGYDVEYDFELKVPTNTDFALKTVNSGDIEVRNMKGEFEVRNVNGGIEMKDIAGSGRVSTVNGDVRVSFAENPTSSVSFKTVNGEVEVEFPDPLSASLKLKTMNGEVYTDFPVKNVPQAATFKEKHGGKKVYRSGDSFVVQTGSGGPELSFDTLNGDIYLSLKGEK